MKKFEVITIFPEIISDYTKIGIVARAIKKNLISIKAFDLRKVTKDSHQTVDDRPYGGGVGMVLKPDIMQKAIYKTAGSAKPSQKSGNKIRKDNFASLQRIILLTPQGKVFNQADAKRLAKYNKIIFVSGRYEGFDERIRKLTDEEFSIGDYILMGGELAALVMIETISRFVPGVVGKFESTINESFATANLPNAKRLLEYPQYTRPEVLKVGKKNMSVPKVLLSGDHAKIKKWRLAEALKRTKKRRPDIL
jgi:tRNA (guanine37-N1)-methyltransferase